MKKAFKYRLYPDRATQQHLSWTLTRCRELYNAGLSERKDAYQQYQRVTFIKGQERTIAAIMTVGRQMKPMSFYSQKRDLVEIKQERPEYQDIASHVLQDGLNRLDKAFAAFFRRVKNGETPGYPRFKGRNRYNNFTYPDGAGWKFDGKYLHLTKIGKAHRKIARQRRDFLHKASRKLIKRYQVLVFEDIQMANLVRRPKPKQDENGTYLPNGASAKGGLNKSILDAGWGAFVAMCSVKAEEAGRTLIKVNPQFTSQVCSQCGQVRKKDLSERWHSCECVAELDRDVNAAINILARGKRVLGGKHPTSATA